MDFANLIPGERFPFEGRIWIAAPTYALPTCLDGFKGKYGLLFASGNSINDAQETRGKPDCWSWVVGQGHPGQIVGYWYEDVTKLKTMTKFGKEWIVTDGKAPDPMPDWGPGEWEYLNSYGRENHGFESIGNNGWGWASITAYRHKNNPAPVLSDKFIKDDVEWIRWDAASGRMPKELLYVLKEDFQLLIGDNLIATKPTCSAISCNWTTKSGIRAWRIIDRAPVVKRVVLKESGLVTEVHEKHGDLGPALPTLAEQKATADMIERDGKPETAQEKHDRLVKAMTGNGNIFAPPKVEVHPLYRVAPMTTTGTSLWGTEHEK